MALWFYAIACNTHVHIGQCGFCNEPLLPAAPLREKEHLGQLATPAQLRLGSASSVPVNVAWLSLGSAQLSSMHYELQEGGNAVSILPACQKLQEGESTYECYYKEPRELCLNSMNKQRGISASYFFLPASMFDTPFGRGKNLKNNTISLS